MMKGFKFGLVAILLGLFGFTCFSNAEIFVINGDVDSNTYNDYAFHTDIPLNNFQATNRICSNGNNCQFYAKSASGYECYLSSANGNWSCNGQVVGDITIKYKTNLSWLKPFTQIVLSYFECPTCEICEECETCPEVDTNYCVENDLCPVSSGVSWSELVINDIVHESAPLINITIPEEYSWDYSVDENEFALVISGQNVDYAYIDNIITTQKGKPNNVDFNNIVSGLIPLLIPGLVIILFIWFIFRFIKKIF